MASPRFCGTPSRSHHRRAGDATLRAGIPVAQTHSQLLAKQNGAAQAERPVLYCCSTGRGTRIRTLDLLIKSQLLYQLSYTPVETGRPCWDRTNDQRIKSPRLYRLS